MVDLEYLKMSKPQKICHDAAGFFKSLPGKVAGGLKGLVMFVVNLFKSLGLSIADLVTTFREGDWKTRVSFLIMGFGKGEHGAHEILALTIEPGSADDEEAIRKLPDKPFSRKLGPAVNTLG